MIKPIKTKNELKEETRRLFGEEQRLFAKPNQKAAINKEKDLPSAADVQGPAQNERNKRMNPVQ